jgi:hypothetical protein
MLLVSKWHLVEDITKMQKTRKLLRSLSTARTVSSYQTQITTKPILFFSTTQRRYSKQVVERDPKFATVKTSSIQLIFKLSKKDVDHFRSIVGDTGVLTSDLEGYNTDWLGKYNGKSKLVLRPKTTEQVSQILKHCHARKLAVVPQAGNTGLVGGSVPVFDEIIINTSLMNNIRCVN